MANPLLAAGATLDKPPKYAPLHTNEFFTGFWPNRNPMRDGATPYLYQKFYSANRYDAIIDGQNIELSPRLTPIRAPGSSVYNSQTFDAINDFYSFRVFNPYTQANSIIVLCDTATEVLNCTGPSTKSVLFTKSSGAGQTSFQSVGNTLYFGNGVDAKKWVWAPAWATGTKYPVGGIVLDSSNYIQSSLGLGSKITQISVTSDVLEITTTGNYSGTSVGDTISFQGVTTYTALNGLSLQVSSIPDPIHLKFDFTAADYSATADTGFAANGIAGTTSGSAPTFSDTIGAVSYDSTNRTAWICKGPSVQNWGIAAPPTAPSAVNTPNTNAGNAWAASTYYNPSLLIVDSNSNLQLLTTAGTTDSSVPTWNTSGTTTDGTAVWTFQGQAARQTSHAYAVGDVIAITYTYWIEVPTVVGREIVYKPVKVGPFYWFFQCTTAGTSSALADGSITWPASGSVTDGSVTWRNVGPQITRTSSSSSAGNSTVSGNIGNSQAVSTNTQIVDSSGSGGGTGYLQTIVTAGESGASHPSWSTTQGANTTDNQAVWTNAGAATVANTGAWLYGYAYKNSVTGHVSSMSTASSSVTLAALSLISVSGTSSFDNQVDTIQIYRTTQGQADFFWLAEIPAPLNGAPWAYTDASPDPGVVINSVTGLPTYTNSPSSTMNVFISADTVGNNAPPPSGITNLAFHLNRVWGSVGAFSYYSIAPGASIGVGAESFPGFNYFQFPEVISKSWPISNGIEFFCIKGVYLSNGTDSSGNPAQPTSYLEDWGVLTPNAFSVNGSTALVLTSDHQQLALDPNGGVSRTGFPIETSAILGTIDPASAYLTWHTNGGDQALYLADGSTGWYRLNLTPAPENTGSMWAPKRTIQGGCKCVKSVETTPGTNDLLIGPASSGVILKRDLSASDDNGAAYDADFTIGSIVLAQPGECAEVAFITTECKNLGSNIIVSILGDEISGTFETLSQSVPDPPFLAPSQSLYATRWYFSTLQQPAWMRHLQIKFSWPKESKANEMLTYTIYGSIHNET